MSSSREKTHSENPSLKISNHEGFLKKGYGSDEWKAFPTLVQLEDNDEWQQQAEKNEILFD